MTSVANDAITLDFTRTYSVSANLRSFSAFDLSTQPLIASRGQYAQVGIDEETVVWIGRIAAVVRRPEPTVFYVGRLARVEDGRAIFHEGTVLRVLRGVRAPANRGDMVQAEIDPIAHVVRRLRAA